MAATWETKITIIDLAGNRVRVTAVRTDGEDVQTFSALGVVDPSAPAASKTRLVNALWDAYRAAKAKIDAANDILAGWEAALATSLSNKESK